MTPYVSTTYVIGHVRVHRQKPRFCNFRHKVTFYRLNGCVSNSIQQENYLEWRKSPVENTYGRNSVSMSHAQISRRRGGLQSTCITPFYFFEKLLLERGFFLKCGENLTFCPKFQLNTQNYDAECRHLPQKRHGFHPVSQYSISNSLFLACVIVNYQNKCPLLRDWNNNSIQKIQLEFWSYILKKNKISKNLFLYTIRYHAEIYWVRASSVSGRCQNVGENTIQGRNCTIVRQGLWQSHRCLISPTPAPATLPAYIWKN